MTAPDVPEGTGGALPLVDPTALRLLAADVGRESAASFARDFMRIWPRRRAEPSHLLDDGGRGPARGALRGT